MEKYDVLPDSRLAALAQNGDDGATGALINRYKSVVRSISRRFFVKGADSDDLLQEGMIGLFKAITGYVEPDGPDNTYAFDGFARKCIRNQILNEIRSLQSRKNDPLDDYVPFVEDCEELVGYIDSPEDTVIESETRNSMTRELYSVLSELEKRVLVKYFDGIKYSEIAAELGCTEKTVANAMCRVRRKWGAFYEQYRENS